MFRNLARKTVNLMAAQSKIFIATFGITFLVIGALAATTVKPALA
jgi:hypothetical protein